MSSIRFLQRNEIDAHKWDAAIYNSLYPLPYALTTYLDAVAENWDAFILNDYEVVMPLVWLRKLGVKCLYQPYYCQQLGLFSAGIIGSAIYADFLQAARSKFPYIHINLNPGAAAIATEFGLTEKKNLLLDLNTDYGTLQKGYSSNHRRAVAKANKTGLVFSDQIGLPLFQQFYLGNVNRDKENFKPKHEAIFKALSAELIGGKQAIAYGAVSPAGTLLAAVLLVEFKNRLIGIINTSSAEGKKEGASHFVFDQLIQKFAGSGFVLDFEGSSIPGVARFYESFGAKPEIFYLYEHSLLKGISSRFK